MNNAPMNDTVRELKDAGRTENFADILYPDRVKIVLVVYVVLVQKQEDKKD